MRKPSESDYKRKFCRKCPYPAGRTQMIRKLSGQKNHEIRRIGRTEGQKDGRTEEFPEMPESEGQQDLPEISGSSGRRRPEPAKNGKTGQKTSGRFFRCQRR